MKKTSISLFIVMIFFCFTVNAIGKDKHSKVNQENLEKAKQVYKCEHTNSPIVIDGIISEDAWKNANSLNFYTCIALNNPIDCTKARMLWDDNNIYIAFKASDNEIISKFTQRDSWCYQEDCLEVFIYPDFNKKAYYNFEINAIGTIYDSYNIDTSTGMEYKKEWNAKSTSVATHINGTLNSPNDEDRHFTMEVKIPFSDLPGLIGKVPNNGDSWKFTLGRSNLSSYLPASSELSCTAPLSRLSFHAYKDYQTLMFIK